MQPLENLRIVVTRAAHQAEELAAPLRKLGAEVVLLPVISIAPAADPIPLRNAARQLGTYDWIIFTSANAVSAFAAELPGTPEIGKVRVATVGAATRDAAEQYRFAVSITPEKYVAESVAAAFSGKDLSGCRILIPSAAVTRDVVASELRKQGAVVNVVEAYRNVVPPEAQEQATKTFGDSYPDWVTFASSSAVDNLVRLVGVEMLRKVKIATIGPVTSDTVRKHGLAVAAEAAIHSIPGLVEVLTRSVTA